MARKTTGKSSASQTPRQKAVTAALALAGEKPWEKVTLAEISKKAKLSFADLHEMFADKTDILAAYGRVIDQRVLENAEANQGESCRDSLFDLMMERFDVLNENREAVCSILRSHLADPKQTVIGLPHLAQSMSWMLEAAGMSTSGLSGAVRVAGLTGIYVMALRVWKEDDSEDLSKTMAALDRYLSRAERWTQSFL